MNASEVLDAQRKEYIAKISELLAKLANTGDVDESWEIQRVIDALYPDDPKEG